MASVAEPLGQATVCARVLSKFGFDPTTTKISDAPALSAIIRRLASFVAPCSSRALIAEVRSYVGDLLSDDDVEDLIDNQINALVNYGDLHEATRTDGNALFIYLGQPSFIARSSGLVFLVGIVSDGRELLPDLLHNRIEFVGHTRRLKPNPNENLPEILGALGFCSLPEKLWFRSPRTQTASELIGHYDRMLNEASHPGTVTDLLVLDSSKPVRYYRGRWTLPRNLTGRYVLRRPQRFGSPLWCYGELRNGQLTKLVDFPSDRWRPCDHAWRLQLAIDHNRGVSQVVQVSSSVHPGYVEAAFFSPIPGWARSRWDIVGKPVDRRGSLFAYSFAESEIDEERKKFFNELWLSDSSRQTREEPL